MNTGFKAQLKDVLSNAVSYFQDSGDPNDACIKAANEAGFNEDQADRLVETFNTARVICHYKAAEDKTSSCSLADKNTVRGKLTAPAEAAKEAEYNTVDYGCYKQAEIDYVVPEVKVAETTVREDPLSKEAEDWLKCREIETIRECVKSAEEEARAAYAMADALAIKIAERLSRNVSIDDIHDKVARMVTAYALDDRYAPGVEKVAEFIPEASDPDASLLQKYARMHIVPTDDLEAFMPAIKEAADFVAEAAALEAYAESMKKEAQEAPLDGSDLEGLDHNQLADLLVRERIIGERRRNAAPITAGHAPASGGSSGGGSKGGGGGGSGKGSFLVSLTDLAKKQYDTESQGRIDKATNTVNNLRRQLILQDLLVRDKVLSQEDPNAVAAAFRSINQVSPDTTLNKEVLRSMLRSAVQSVAISPYDAKTLADVDKARHQAYDKKETVGGKDNA